MGEQQKSWISHLISIAALLVFGLMALACFDLENLDPVEAAIFWDYPPEPIMCDAIDGAYEKSIDARVVVGSPFSDEDLEGALVDITFSFYPSEWTGEWDTNGDPICAQELEWSSTSSHVTDYSGQTDWVSSPIATWSDTKDLLVISWEASKPGYTSSAGSIRVKAGVLTKQRIYVSLVNLDDIPD